MAPLATRRFPLQPGRVSQAARLRGWAPGRFDEQRAGEAPVITLPVRSSVAGRKIVHHFAWQKFLPPFRQTTDGLAMAAGYRYGRSPKIINSRTPTRAVPRPQMSRYPRPSAQGGMSVSPRFVKASRIKPNTYRPPLYGAD